MNPASPGMSGLRSTDNSLLPPNRDKRVVNHGPTFMVDTSTMTIFSFLVSSSTFVVANRFSVVLAHNE